MPKKVVLFEQSHSEMLSIKDQDFSEFINLLKSLTLKIITNENKNLTNQQLQRVDILVIGNPIDDYFSNIEIKNIINFVRDGGRLLLISEYGGDYLQKTNLNDITGKNFGIYFQKNIVKQNNSINQNCSSIISIQNFQKHQITKQLREIVISGTCSLLLKKESNPLLYLNESWTEIYNGSNEQWSKENENMKQIISASAEYGRGKVVAIGDIDIFSNDSNIGLNCLDNRKFVLNLISWLLEPVKESDVTLWALNQLGTIQIELKRVNNKINNIIETMTILEHRISALEEEKDDAEIEKRLVEEELSEF
ncbi:MAG: hypothetical protein EU529_09095 [Promethearchaeota archaeon]|nr:MAG: hypothetical protein EU529_09095 [Candidatus Lokiarchaeota archaeon]